MRRLTTTAHNLRTLRYSSSPTCRVRKPLRLTGLIHECIDLCRGHHRRISTKYSPLILPMVSVFIQCPKSSRMGQLSSRLMAGATILVLIPLDCTLSRPYKVRPYHSKGHGHSTWHRFLRLPSHNSPHSRHSCPHSPWGARCGETHMRTVISSLRTITACPSQTEGPKLCQSRCTWGTRWRIPHTLATRPFPTDSTCRILNSVGAFSAVCGRLI